MCRLEEEGILSKGKHAVSEESKARLQAAQEEEQEAERSRNGALCASSRPKSLMNLGRVRS